MEKRKKSDEPPQILDVILKGGRPWGLSLKGGLETSSALVISKIEPGGRVAQEGTLKVGDLILYINNVPCDSRAEAIELVRSAFKTLSITVQRGGIDQNTTPRTTLFLQRFKDFRERETEKLEQQLKDGAAHENYENLPPPPGEEDLGIYVETDYQNNRFHEPPSWQDNANESVPRSRSESLPSSNVVTASYHRRLSYPAPPDDLEEVSAPDENMQVANTKSTPNLHMDKLGYPRPFSGHNHGASNKSVYRDANANPTGPPTSRGRNGGVYNILNSQSALPFGPTAGSGAVYEKDYRRHSGNFTTQYTSHGQIFSQANSGKGTRDRDSSGSYFRPYERSSYNRAKDYENLRDFPDHVSLKYQSQSSPDLSRDDISISSECSVRTLQNVSPEPPVVPPRPSNEDLDAAPAPPMRDSSSFVRYNQNQDVGRQVGSKSDKMHKHSVNVSFDSDIKYQKNYPFQGSYDLPLKKGKNNFKESLTSPKKPSFQTDIIHHAKVAKVTNIENETEFSTKAYGSLDPKSEAEVRSLFNSPPSYLYPSYESGSHKYCDRDFMIPSPPQQDLTASAQKKQMNPPSADVLDQKQLDQMIGEYIDSYKAHQKKIKASPAYHDKKSVPKPNSSTTTTNTTTVTTAAGTSKMTASVIRSPNELHNAKDPSRAFMCRPKPHYSTSTQTDDLPSPVESPAVQVQTVPLVSRPEDVFHDDPHNKSTSTDPDAPVLRRDRRNYAESQIRPVSMPSDSSSRPSSSLNDSSSRPTSYAEYDLDKGAITDRSSSLEYENSNVNPFKPIHDYSPSTAPLLRRLSEEFFHQKDPSARHSSERPGEPTVPEEEQEEIEEKAKIPSKKGPIVKRPIRFEEIDIPLPPSGKTNERRLSIDIPVKVMDEKLSGNHCRQSSIADDDMPPSVPERRRSAGRHRLSMKKAYGIGDDADLHPEPLFKTSRSTSNIPEEPLNENRKDMRRSESEAKSIKLLEKKLKRTSSEQFRPLKDRFRKSNRQGSDPESEHSRKSSDCSDVDQVVPKSGHNRWQNLSDPLQTERSSTPQSNEKRSNSDPKQLPYVSVSGKVKTPTSDGKRRTGSDPMVLDPEAMLEPKSVTAAIRSHSTFGSQDSGYRSDRTSDPELKKLQQWGYFDKRVPYVEKPRSEEVYNVTDSSNLPGRMASTLPPGMEAPDFSKYSEFSDYEKHTRSVSYDYESLASKEKINFRSRPEVEFKRPERPKSFGEHRLHPAALRAMPDSTRNRPDSLASHSSLASLGSSVHHRDRGYGFDGESQRLRSQGSESDVSRIRSSYRLSYDGGNVKSPQPESEVERLDSSDARSTPVSGGETSPTKKGPLWRRSKTPENSQHSRSRDSDQLPYADVSRLSTASMKALEQTGSSTDLTHQQKYGPYPPVTSEADEQKPPLLPPRLYRTKNTVLQEKPQDLKDGKRHHNYDNIGEADHSDVYADKLRQQAMKFTQAQSMNILKYKAKPHNETVVTSRPVKPVERYQSVPESRPIEYRPAEPLSLANPPVNMDSLRETRPLSTSSPKPLDEYRIKESQVDGAEPDKAPSKSLRRSSKDFRASSPEFYFPPPPEDPPSPLSKSFNTETSEEDLSLPPPPPPLDMESNIGQIVESVPQVQREFAKPLSRYSSESYITNRNNIPRRGFYGNYRRSDSSGGLNTNVAGAISPSDAHGDYVNLVEPTEQDQKPPSPPKQLSYSPNSAFTNQIAPRPAMENGDAEDYKRAPVSSQVAKFEKGNTLFKPIDHTPTVEAKSVISKNVLDLTSKFGGSKDSLNRSTENLSRCSDNVSRSSESSDGKAGERSCTPPGKRSCTPPDKKPREKNTMPKVQDENIPPRAEKLQQKLSTEIVIENNRNNFNPSREPRTDLVISAQTNNQVVDNQKDVAKEKVCFQSSGDQFKNSQDTPLMNQLRRYSSSQNQAPSTDEVFVPQPEPQRPLPPVPQPVPQVAQAAVHVRQKSQEEIECDEVIEKLANELKEKDKALSEVISPPNTFKVPHDYYGDIFDKDMVAGVHRNLVSSPSIGAGSQSVKDSNQDTQSSESPLPPTSPYWVSPSTANLEKKLREDGVRDEMIKTLGDDTASLDRKKEELIERIETKLTILKEAKKSLADDIESNNELGRQVTKIVEEKLQNPKELDKYKTYVDELDKIMHLLLKLVGRLARAENAVLSLPNDASERERMSLVSKRDKLGEQHEDAKKLKEGIDRRSEQVAGYLKKDLTPEEIADYEVFIKMKSKLIMEEREIDDKITLGEEQLKALNKSMLHRRDPDDLDFYFD